MLRLPLESALHAAVAVVDQPGAADRPARVQGLFEGIQHEAGRRRAADPPADNAPGEGIDDEAACTKPLQVAT